MQKVNDAPAVDCPACHEPTLKRLISAAGFQLKGTGWYVTDFRDKGKPKTTEATASTTKDKSEKQIETKKETKKDKVD